MIRLIRRSLGRRETSEFIFVEFNAWLYQGYDDARAALMEVIASTLATEAEKRKKGVEKAKEFLERINWFRLAKLVAGSAVSLSVGLPPVGLLGELCGLGQRVASGGLDQQAVSDMEHAATGVAGAAAGGPAAQKRSAPPKEIH